MAKNSKKINKPVYTQEQMDALHTQISDLRNRLNRAESANISLNRKVSSLSEDLDIERCGAAQLRQKLKLAHSISEHLEKEFKGFLSTHLTRAEDAVSVAEKDYDKLKEIVEECNAKIQNLHDKHHKEAADYFHSNGKSHPKSDDLSIGSLGSLLAEIFGNGPGVVGCSSSTPQRTQPQNMGRRD